MNHKIPKKRPKGLFLHDDSTALPRERYFCSAKSTQKRCAADSSSARSWSHDVGNVARCSTSFDVRDGRRRSYPFTPSAAAPTPPNGKTFQLGVTAHAVTRNNRELAERIARSEPSAKLERTLKDGARGETLVFPRFKAPQQTPSRSPEQPHTTLPSSSSHPH
jgi:hypothetical protein